MKHIFYKVIPPCLYKYILIFTSGCYYQLFQLLTHEAKTAVVLFAVAELCE